MAREACQIHLEFGAKQNIDGVSFGITRMSLDFGDLLFILDEPFGKEESCRQLRIMSRRAHGDTDRAGIDLNLQRFFAGDGIELGDLFSTGVPFPGFNFDKSVQVAFCMRALAL